MSSWVAMAVTWCDDVRYTRKNARSEQHWTALISGLLHYDAIRSEQDNVATPVTAMMATVCISTDVRPEQGWCHQTAAAMIDCVETRRDPCVNPRSRSCSAINSRACLLAIEIRVDVWMIFFHFEFASKKQFKQEQKQIINMQGTASRKKTITRRERYVQLYCDKLKFMKVQMHSWKKKINIISELQ